MRFGYLVAVSVIVTVLSATSWVVAPAPAADSGSADAGARIAGAASSPTRPALRIPRAAPAPAAPEAEPGPAPSAPPALATEPEPVPVSASDPAALAAAFLVDINELRAAQGLAPLELDATLDGLAAAWVATMATEDDLRHSELIYDVVAGPWIAAGENVGYGPSEPAIFAGLEESPGHRANMVDPAYTHVGIAVVVVGPAVWTAHLFAG